jgi:hypothetical protein
MAGLPKMRIHDLRHSAVAILIAQGVNIKAIIELTTVRLMRASLLASAFLAEI